jgi:4-hydroxybutyrate CoA-transferase
MVQRSRKLDNWQEDFKKKRVSPEEAAGVVKSGDYVVLPNEYFGVLPYYLVDRRNELSDVTVEICVAFFDPGWLQPGMEDTFNIIIRCYLHLARIAHDEGRIPFIPVTNGTWLKPYRDNRPMDREIDVFLVVVSPPDENGFCYFANGIWEKRFYAGRAKTVIAEMDELCPRTYGDTAIHISEIDYLVDITPEPLTGEEIDKLAGIVSPEKQGPARQTLSNIHPGLFRNLLPAIDMVPPDLMEFALNIDDPTDVMKAMAANLKTILNDTDTLQIGTGKHTKHLVELGVFDDLNDLSIFSEMACPGMGYLVKRGIATGKYASLHPGKAVFTSLMGMTPDEVKWAGNNPLFELCLSD